MKYLALSILISGLTVQAAPRCRDALLDFKLPGLEVATLEDASGSTGATMFYFPKSAIVAFDARGGSVATSETTLLSEGSYEGNTVDAIVFAGGSTMGLAAADGVRSVLFNQRAEAEGDFDFIPSVVGAVIYDFDGRRMNSDYHPLVYPDHDFGVRLFEQRSASLLELGRKGVGKSATVNKMGEPIWGGQGAAFAKLPWGRIFVAVVLNSVGDIIKDGKSFTSGFNKLPDRIKAAPKKNTTLSIVVTDLKLNRDQLKRLSISLHTSMARSIHPFHTYEDGDINFAASVGEKKLAVDELEIQLAASKLMQEAIEKAVANANK